MFVIVWELILLTLYVNKCLVILKNYYKQELDLEFFQIYALKEKLLLNIKFQLKT